MRQLFLFTILLSISFTRMIANDGNDHSESRSSGQASKGPKWGGVIISEQLDIR